MSNLAIAMVHLVQDNGELKSGAVINVGTICAINYRQTETGSFHFTVQHMGNGEVSFESDSLQAGLQKVGVSLAGLKIL